METISILGLLGILVSLYATYVERINDGKKKYKVFCDVNDGMSCTRVLTSKYARMVKLCFGLDDDSWFDMTNSCYGLLFYIYVFLYPIIIFPFSNYLFFGAALFAILFCFVLAYIMYVKLNDICLVCIATYVINTFILLYAYYEVFI